VNRLSDDSDGLFGRFYFLFRAESRRDAAVRDFIGRMQMEAISYQLSALSGQPKKVGSCRLEVAEG
jgi:hypothetical protein